MQCVAKEVVAFVSATPCFLSWSYFCSHSAHKAGDSEVAASELQKVDVLGGFCGCQPCLPGRQEGGKT